MLNGSFKLKKKGTLQNLWCKFCTSLDMHYFT